MYRLTIVKARILDAVNLFYYYVTSCTHSKSRTARDFINKKFSLVFWSSARTVLTDDSVGTERGYADPKTSSTLE